jgi:quinate dehydrogenase (quinone)
MKQANIILKRRSGFAIITGFILVVVGLPIAYGGGVLIGLGGSFYYLPAGIGLIASGLLLAMQRSRGAWFYGIVYLGTLMWAVAEVGVDFWPLVPRVAAPTVLALLVFVSMALLARARQENVGTETGGQGPSVTRSTGRSPSWQAYVGYAGAAVMTLALVAIYIASFYPHNAIYVPPSSPIGASVAQSTVGDWTAFGGTAAGRRFAPLTQIDKENVNQLQVAWIARSGDVPNKTGMDEATPIQIGEKLITCSPSNIIHALDVDTGSALWTFNPKAEGVRQRCRGVSFFDASNFEMRSAGEEASGKVCLRRVVMTTIDSRLIELDLETGKPCAQFGDNGVVNLRAGIGGDPKRFYAQTSAPLVAKTLIIVGGGVADGQNVNAPSGVVRAFDALTGELRWAWDLGRPSDPNARLSRDAVFTPGTPNVWAPPSFDEKLGLIFLPTGNASPDLWGGNRTPAMERYSSAIVALDLDTGQERWTFQTTHHDLWDYDVASQPSVYDLPDGQGGFVPALIVPTKHGQIFVLDRRTGTPIKRVVEKPAPPGPMADDRPSPTQPYSIDMPANSPARLNEADMWGLTPLDQLWCRITFRKLRYDGRFTPPGLARPSLEYPGDSGGFNWGGASIDETNALLLINDMRIADLVLLVSRADADREGLRLRNRLPGRKDLPSRGGVFPQLGTPYAAIRVRFMSPLDVPCQKPPFGTMSGIDLKSGQLVWQVPIGTTQDTGPLGVPTGLNMQIGLPTLGGSVATRSGLVFFAGTQDFYLRALDSSTGHELWRGRLPAGSSASPMTFISPRTGRQFVVIAAGGTAESPIKGDFLIAYALPERRPRVNATAH